MCENLEKFLHSPLPSCKEDRIVFVEIESFFEAYLSDENHLTGLSFDFILFWVKKINDISCFDINITSHKQLGKSGCIDGY